MLEEYIKFTIARFFLFAKLISICLSLRLFPLDCKLGIDFQIIHVLTEDLKVEEEKMIGNILKCLMLDPK